jgi:NAD(P)-dependent dehydrogenase (short-subunit alcohol dehydrogenase family)
MGAHLAHEFHGRGDRVFATARNPSKMESLKAAGIEAITLDVESEESIQACFSQVSSLTDGSLDILVNNAGRGYCMPLTDVSIAEAKKVFDLNFWAILRTTQVFLPLLLKAARSHGRALLVNQTSVSSVLGSPFFGVYNTSKAAAAMLIQNLRVELGPFGIQVIDLKTGGVRTNIHDNDPECHLPPDSLFMAVQHEIGKLSKGDIGMDSQDARVWAKNVVSDLDKDNPPHIIWRGKSASQIKMASKLPISMLDSTLKKVAKLDVLEQKLKAS